RPPGGPHARAMPDGGGERGRRVDRARWYGVTVWFEMRKESLGFLDRAPVVHVAEAVIAAPRKAGFGAIAEPRGRKHWFPGLREASYATPPPHGVGTIREANVGGTRWVEEMIDW